METSTKCKVYRDVRNHGAQSTQIQVDRDTSSIFIAVFNDTCKINSILRKHKYY